MPDLNHVSAITIECECVCADVIFLYYDGARQLKPQFETLSPGILTFRSLV